MKKLKIGLVGAGNIGQNAHIPVYMERGDVELAAVCDINLDRAKACAEKYGVPHVFERAEELVSLPELDAVDVCVWNGSHGPVVIAAANAGKHILCEKPMALNLEMALDMEKAVKKNGKIFMMAMPRRYDNKTMLLNSLRESGDFGDIYFAKTGSVRRRGTPLGWFTDTSKSGGGPVIDIGVHCIDCTWYLMGRPTPTRVSAATSYKIGDYKTKGVDRWIALDSDVTAFDTEDSAAGVIHFENGAVMLFEVSWAINAEPTEYIAISGSKAGFKLGGGQPLTIYGEAGGHLTDNTPTTLPNNNFATEIDHFINCVNTGARPDSPLEDGVTIMRMLQGIYDSAKLGREVVL